MSTVSSSPCIGGEAEKKQFSRSWHPANSAHASVTHIYRFSKTLITLQLLKPTSKCVLKQFSLCQISIRIYYISPRSSSPFGGGFKACVTYWCLVQSGERNGCFGTAFYANLKAIEYRTHCVPERKYRGKAINDIFCLKMGLKCFQI